MKKGTDNDSKLIRLETTVLFIEIRKLKLKPVFGGSDKFSFRHDLW